MTPAATAWGVARVPATACGGPPDRHGRDGAPLPRAVSAAPGPEAAATAAGGHGVEGHGAGGRTAPVALAAVAVAVAAAGARRAGAPGAPAAVAHRADGPGLLAAVAVAAAGAHRAGVPGAPAAVTAPAARRAEAPGASRAATVTVPAPATAYRSARIRRAGGTTLMVIAKEPLPGRVKTRLTPPYTPREAAGLAEAALADTLAAVLATPARRRVLVLDGRPGPWLPAGFEVVPQAPGGLDERLAAAFGGCTGPALLVGMDTPQLTPELLRPAVEPSAWDGCAAWFGPAADGGFWALGLADPDPELLRGVPMSRPDTGRLQRERLTRAGLAVRDLSRLRDVDTAADALEVAAAAPDSRFAAALARLTPSGAR